MRDANRRRGGMALLLALVTVLVISALLSGMLVLSVSHFSLSHTNSDYANALSLAEAGINWELWKVSRNASEADQAPTTVEFPAGSGRTFRVEVEAYPDGGVWVPPSAFWVIGTGTVDGVSRTVRVVAGGESLTGQYALFGIDSLDIGGSIHVIGASGTNGIVDEHGSPELEGNFWYCGSASGDQITYPPDSPYTVYHSPLPEYFPTVNELANLRAQERWGVTTDLGVDFFATTDASGNPYNDNSTIRDTAGNPVGVKNGTIDWKDKNIALAGATLWDGTPIPVEFQGKPVVVLLPGDYYFTGLRTTGNEFLMAHDRDGVVNVWLGPANSTGGQPDVLTGNSVCFSNLEQSNFHVYEGSQRPLVMEGTTDFYGQVYAYNGPDDSGQYWGEIILRGTNSIFGSVLGYDVSQVTGNTTITYPSGGGPLLPGDPIGYYGFESSWEEMNAL